MLSVGSSDASTLPRGPHRAELDGGTESQRSRWRVKRAVAKHFLTHWPDQEREWGNSFSSILWAARTQESR